MENLESHGILKNHFPGLESHGFFCLVMESKSMIPKIKDDWKEGTFQFDLATGLRVLVMAFQGFQISKFSGHHAPRPP